MKKYEMEAEERVRLERHLAILRNILEERKVGLVVNLMNSLNVVSSIPEFEILLVQKGYQSKFGKGPGLLSAPASTGTLPTRILDKSKKALDAARAV